MDTKMEYGMCLHQRMVKLLLDQLRLVSHMFSKHLLHVTCTLVYSPDNTACLWDINSSTLLLKYTGHTGSGEISHDIVVVVTLT